MLRGREESCIASAMRFRRTIGNNMEILPDAAETLHPHVVGSSVLWVSA
jgi:hypothetical protein